MLMRFDPFRELDRLSEVQNRTWSTMLAMDAYRHDHEFIVDFDLPGAEPDSIDLSVEKNVLTVRAERTTKRLEGDEVVVAERRQGSFARQLFLGDNLDADHIRAAYENGVLTITIPVAERAKARQIQVETAQGEAQPVEAQKLVDAQSTDTTGNQQSDATGNQQSDATGDQQSDAA